MNTEGSQYNNPAYDLYQLNSGLIKLQKIHIMLNPYSPQYKSTLLIRTKTVNI